MMATSGTCTSEQKSHKSLQTFCEQTNKSLLETLQMPEVAFRAICQKLEWSVLDRARVLCEWYKGRGVKPAPLNHGITLLECIQQVNSFPIEFLNDLTHEELSMLLRDILQVPAEDCIRLEKDWMEAHEELCSEDKHIKPVTLLKKDDDETIVSCTETGAPSLVQTTLSNKRKKASLTSPPTTPPMRRQGPPVHVTPQQKGPLPLPPDAPSLVPSMPKKRNKVEADRETHRKYGDHYLIDRSKKANGIMQLGGNGQETFPHPRENHPRFEKLGNFHVVCFNDLWQPLAPQYAGQPTAFVDEIPEKTNGEPFALFVRRSRTSRAFDATSEGRLLGWEYCGFYKGIKDAESCWEREHNFPPVTKKKIASGILESSNSSAEGYGRKLLKKWRGNLKSLLRHDDSPAGPAYLIEKRYPTEEDLNQPVAPLAARARALGFEEDMSDERLAHLIVKLDEYYSLVPIQFVEYNEAVYDYIKDGKTTKGPDGKNAAGTSAKAQDWYDFHDQQLR